MVLPVQNGTGAARLAGLIFALAVFAGCAVRNSADPGEMRVSEAVQQYAAQHSAALAVEDHAVLVSHRESPAAARSAGIVPSLAWDPSAGDLCGAAGGRTAFGDRFFTLGSFDLGEEPEPASQPTTCAALPEGYWRQDIWHQMGHEALEFGGHGFWRGFKVSYWKLENALVLTAAMGASITIRGTGVDDAIRRRTKGQDELADMSETIQIIGNPATHFGAAGVLWLTSGLTQNVREHEVAKSLIDALAVNGVSTILLKVATNTHAPDGEGLAWPSGHTSSSFCAAAVLNEYYGPWVGIPSLALAGLVGYQRIDSRVHDFSDVVFGGFLGYVIGASIAKDNKTQLPEVFGMKVLPFADPETGASGLALFKQW